MDRIVSIAPAKIEQIREAGKKQLPPEEYERLIRLILDLQVHGLTPYINVELGKILAKIQWGLEISKSPEWAEALIECDRTFLGYELRDMFLEMGVEPPSGHKKELCQKLYMMGQPRVVAVMEPLIGKAVPVPAMVAAPTPPPTPPPVPTVPTIAKVPPAKPKEVVYKPPYQPKLRLTLEQAKERLEGLKQEAALTDRRLEKLRETQRKNPEWKSYDEYAQDYVGIDIRIEEQQAVKELYDEEIATLQKAIEGG